MSRGKAAKQQGPIRLVPLDPDDEGQVAELRRQRILCGWALESVDKWRDMIRRGDRLMYWIFDESDRSPPAKDEVRFLHAVHPSASRHETPPPNPAFTPVGHVALDWEDYLGDKSLADRKNGVITFTSLFILMSKQGKGYASKALNLIEKIAKDDLGCNGITLNTMPDQYFSDAAWWESQGVQRPKGTGSYEQWYQRKGYKPYLLVPRHRYTTLDGKEHIIPCVNMRKDL